MKLGGPYVLTASMNLCNQFTQFLLLNDHTDVTIVAADITRLLLQLSESYLFVFKLKPFDS